MFQTVRVLSNSIRNIIAIFSLWISLETARLLSSGRPETVIRLMVRSAQVLTITTIALCCTWAIIGRTVYAAWLGIHAYPEPLTQLLLLSAIPFVIYSSATLLLSAANLIHCTLLVLIGAALTSIILGIALVHAIGLTGHGCTAWDLSAAALTVFAVHVHFNVPIRNLALEFFSISAS